MSEESWRINHSDDVRKWYNTLKGSDLSQAKAAFARLKENGPQLREPHSKSLGKGLYELRFRCQSVNTRLTYHRHGQEFRTLTVFRKQRQNERREVEKARLRMQQDRARLAERGEGERGSAGKNPGRANEVARHSQQRGRRQSGRSDRERSAGRKKGARTKKKGRER